MNANANGNPCDHVNFVYKLGDNGKFYTSSQFIKYSVKYRDKIRITNG